MNLTLSKRLMLMLVGALVAIIVVGSVGLSTMERINAQLETVQLRYMPAVEALDAFALAFSNVRRASAIYSNAPNERARAAAKKVYVDSIADMKQRLVEFRGKTVGVPDEAPLITGEEEVSQRYLQRAGLLMEQLEAPGADIAALLEEAPKALGAIGAELLKHLDAHREVYNRLTAEGEAQAQRLHESARYWIWGSAIVALLVLGAMGGLLIREIRARLEDLSSHMASISRNQDFTQRIRVTRKDELGQTAEAFNSLVDRMQGNLRSITESARSVAEASSMLAETSSQVAVAAGHQSEAAASVAATVEEITVSINHVGEQAQEADRLSAHSEKLAVEGEEVILRTAGDIQDIAQTVHDAAALIAQLEQSSQKVAGVMQVIRDVADQTNLLALNAAIEAARAGEQGRGFAVVADEVRKLAERTATSTQEITATVGTMIANAEHATSQMNVVVEKVNSGVSSAQQTSESIQGIGQGCRAAVGTVAEIASAIREQGAATTNIAIQIEKIAQMSEQSSAAASESSRGAHRVDELARTMLGVVSAYRLS